MASRLRLSNAEAKRLKQWASSPVVETAITDAAFDRLLYRNGVEGITMRLMLSLAAARADLSAGEGAMQKIARLSALLVRTQKFVRPTFPLTGADVLAAAVSPGPKVGEILGQLEEKWIEFNFSLDRATLIARLEAAVKDQA
jgi:poly(A) polymerase